MTATFQLEREAHSPHGLSAMSAELRAITATNNRALLGEFTQWFLTLPPIHRPSEFLERNIILHTSGTDGKKKPWTFVGREIIREIIDQIDNPDCRKITDCGGTGAGKTLVDYGILLHEFYYNPFPGLYVMPVLNGSGGATAICRDLTHTLDATPIFEDKLPKGAARKIGITRTRLAFAGNDLDFVGAHSASQLGNKRCRIIFIGEQDKVKEAIGREAGTDQLASERLKGMANTKEKRGSTPSLAGYGIWKALIGEGPNSGSDCRRRFLPCPHCNPAASGLNNLGTPHSALRTPHLKGWFVLIKDDQYNIALPNKLPDGTAIPFAKLRWDAAAKRNDSTWDIDRVIRSTRFECPWCGGHIVDKHREWLDRHGVWIPTRTGEPGHYGYQRSSFYSPLVRDDYGRYTLDSTWGGMANKFLEKSENGTIGGWINSDLAEVNASQQHIDQTAIELSNEKPAESKSITWWTELSGDRQANYPGFWYRVRRWCLSILRPPHKIEDQIALLKNLPAEQKALCEKVTGTLLPTKETALYSPHWILQNLQRTDHWPQLAGWLGNNGLTGPALSEYFQREFQTDLMRFLQYIAKPERAAADIGQNGASECLEFGSADSWEEIQEAQRRHKINNPDVIMDARFGQMDNAEVFAECLRQCPTGPTGAPVAPYWSWYAPSKTPLSNWGHHCKDRLAGHKPFAQWAWTPAMGYPENKVWPSKEKNVRLPYAAIEHDPFQFKQEQGQYYLYVFKFDAQWALGELARIRKKYPWTIARNCQIHGHNGEMRPVTMADYNLHMKGYYFDEKENEWIAPGKKGGSQSRKNPNHLYDCEKNGAARAVWKGIFKYQADQRTPQNNP